MKRTFDVVLAAPLGLLACPIILAAAIWIRLTSQGPALIAQERVGRHEKPFRCLKLRTMHQSTQSLPTHKVGEMAVTGAGKILRDLKLDELSQLWNSGVK
jgi:O-antigen biosynthesis protein WbqP